MKDMFLHLHRRILPFLLCLCMMIPLVPLTASADVQDAEHDAKNYSYVDIVNMLTDMERLALLPEVGEKGAESSSYDRGSRYDAASDSYIHWGTNDDGRGIIQNMGNVPGKGTQYLIADLKGPGVIWRTWAAQVDAGLIEIYIDGETEPTISRPFNTFFNNLSAPLNYSGLVYTASNGLNSFVPITYNESCKVYVYDSWGWYYQFTWAQFPEGTQVERMPKTLSVEDDAALKNASDWFWNRLSQNPNDLSEGDNFSGEYKVEAGSSQPVLDYDGKGAVAEFKVKITDELSEKETWDALRALTVSMYWDGDSDPSVWAPLGHFFGTPFADTYVSLPTGLTTDGWYYYYYFMPFADGAKIEIGNDGDRDYNLSVDVTVVPLSNPIAEYARFHAKWNRDKNQLDRPDRFPDHTVLMTEGRGRFLGFMLHHYEKDDFGWWGEGDEKFFVDGESFPSSFGTGSEDYFGYAWAGVNKFYRALHAQPHAESGYDKRGNKVLLRHQTIDSVPFQTSFEGYIEKYMGNDKTEYAVLPMWYLSPEGTDDYGTEPLIRRTDFYRDPPSAAKATVSIEAESMTYSATGDPAPTNSTLTNAAGGRYIQWQNTENSGEITFTFNLADKADGALQIRAAQATTYGMYQFALDGTDIGNPIDLYMNRAAYSTPYIYLDDVSLAKGTHTLSARPVGKNENSTNYYFGLDCLYIRESNNTLNFFEYEDLRLEGFTTGGVSIQNMSSWTGPWSRNEQIFWSPTTATNASLSMSFTLEEAITDQYFTISYTKAGDYGNFQLYIDDVAVGEEQNAYYGPNVIPQTVSLGKITLGAGKHVLKAVVTGKDPRNTQNRYYLGFDYISFTEHEVKPLTPTQMVFNVEGLQYTTTAGTAWGQEMFHSYGAGPWGNQYHLLWPCPGVDQRMDVNFDIGAPIHGMLKIQMTKSFDFGLFDFLLDGEPIGKRVDLYNAMVTTSNGIVLGEVNLEEGTHTLSAVCAGKNAKSTGHLLGWDRIVIEPELPEAGIIDGEDMEVISSTGGHTIRQNMSTIFAEAGEYHNGRQFTWTTAYTDNGKNIDKGSKVVLALDLDEAVDAEMLMNFTTAHYNGIIQLSLDGTKLGDPIDFYGNTPTLFTAKRTDAVSFGRVQLAAGRHELELEVMGKNPLATGYFFGLDCIVFRDVGSCDAEVVPTTIVNGYAANVRINVTVSGLAEDDVVTAALFGQEITVNDGTARFQFAVGEVPQAGIYTPVIKVNGSAVKTDASLEVVPRDDNIWIVNVMPDTAENRTVLGFNADITPKTGANFVVLINDKSMTFTRDGNNLIIPYVVQAGDGIVVKNVKYPILFPSYSFTFNLTYGP